jgi:arginyl-tRNA synthetase
MLQDRIKQAVEDAITAAQADGSLPTFDLPDVEIMRPNQPEHGDYSTNVALVAASAVKKATGQKSNPRQIAQTVVDHLSTAGENGRMLGQVELAGPGFINMHLSDAWLQQQVAAIVANGPAFGDNQQGAGKSALVEYVSANPTGPLTVGHGRNAVLGDTIANLLASSGYEVTREYYFNNAGRQMRVLGQSVRARYEELLADPAVNDALHLSPAEAERWQQHVEQYTTKTISVGEGEAIRVPASFPDDGYLGEYIYDIAQNLIREHGIALLNAEEVAVFKDAAEQAIFADINNTMQRLGIRMDTYFNEYSLYETERVWNVLEELRQRGYVYDADGASWFKTSEFGKEKDTVLVKSSGEPTYRLPDMAYHVDKLERSYDRLVDVFGADHIAAYPDVVKAVELLGFDADRIDVLIYQFVTLVRSGQPVKMSTRKANFVTLDELMDEVGEDVTRFFFLMRSPNSHLEFDLDLAQETSEKNPVYFVQYSHARICSIFRKAEEDGLPFTLDVSDSDVAHALSLLTHPSELTLIRRMLELEEQVQTAVEKLAPHNLTHYAIDLAKVFNAFYRDCKVVDLDAPELSQARLLLSAAARVVLAKVLTLIGVSAPERM